MTEQSFPFGGTAVAEPPAPPLPASYEDESADGGNRQKLMAVGAALGVVVLLVVAFMMLKGGGSDDTAAAVPPGHPTTPTSTTADKGAKPVHLPKDFKGKVGKDPFHALVSPQVAAASGGATGTTTDGATTGTATGTTTDGTTTGTATGTTTDGTATGTTTDGTTTGTTTGTTAPVAQRHPVWVRLAGISNDGKAAVFDVGFGHRKSARVVQFVVKAPAAGSPRIFAQDFALLRVNSSSVLVQFGDGSPFRLDRSNSVRFVG